MKQTGASNLGKAVLIVPHQTEQKSAGRWEGPKQDLAEYHRAGHTGQDIGNRGLLHPLNRCYDESQS